MDVGLLATLACLAGSLALPSCTGEGFTGTGGAGGGSGEPSGGTTSGGSSSGAAGEASGASAGTGEGGDAGQSEGGGDGSGGLPEGGAPTTMGGSAGAGQAGRAGSSSGGGKGGGGGTGGTGGTGGGGTGGTGGSPATGVKAFDDFVASAEGWSVTGDDMTKTVKYSSTGGKPNGSISAEEATTGTLFFTAPQKYLGNASAYYGGEFRFDLKAAPTQGDFFAYADVELTSNLVTLAYDCTPNPTTSWQSYVVPLTETGWKLTSITGAAVTAAQFKAVLANLTRVRIRGEFSNQQDIGYLDNVYLGSKTGAAGQ